MLAIFNVAGKTNSNDGKNIKRDTKIKTKNRKAKEKKKFQR